MAFKKGYKSERKGKKYSEIFGNEQAKEILKKISDAHLGQMHPYKGKKMPPEVAQKHIGKNLGRKPWNYIDGRSKTFGTDRYGRGWKRIRSAVFIRDNFTCCYCNKSEILLHIHHKIPFLLTRDNSLDNLITLCPKCHKIEEIRVMKLLKKQEAYL